MFDQQASDNATRFPSAKYWLGPYAIAVSTLFLWGYWGSFHVNVLEFIGIADIVKAAVYPVASAFAFFALGAVLGETLSPTLNLPPGGGVDTKIGRFLHKAFPFLATAYMLGLAYYFLAGPVEKWRVLPVLFAVMVYLPLKSTGLLAQDFKSDGVRSIAVFLLAALPVFAYGRGVLEANDVLAGKSYAYVVSYLPSQSASVGANAEERPRYIGRADDRYVFFEPTISAISFIAVGEVSALVLKRHERGIAVSARSAKSLSTPSKPKTEAKGASAGSQR